MMIAAQDSLREGHLEQALEQLQQQVRSDPSDAKSRVFLFQLLMVVGQWDRALTQLNVAGELDANNLAMVQAYREALCCEALRRDIFAGKKSPLVFGEPEQWVALLIEALRLDADGQFEQAQQLRDQAFDAAPATDGSIDGQPFEWIADADPRLGPVLEALVNGKYYWVPFHRIRRIHLEEPVDLRDVVWTPVHFEWTNGGQIVGMIPTRYPGSETSEDPQIKMARKTVWHERPDGLCVGEGQRMLATDAGEFSLMDSRKICLGPQAEDSADAGVPGDGTA